MILIPHRLRDHCLGSGHFVDLAVYLHLLAIDDAANGETFLLPAREDMVQRCKISHQVLSRAYHCLEGLELLAIHCPHSRRGIRRTVRLHRLTPVVAVVDQLSQGVLASGRRFSPQLEKLHAACRRSDKRSQTLADYTLDYLAGVAGNPTDEDLTTAISEVEAFDRPAGGFILSIVAVFLSRFKKDATRRYAGTLDPGRQNIMHEPTTRPLKKRRTDPDPDLYNIHPTGEYTAAQIDWICYSLLDGRTDLMAGDLPLFMLDLPSISRDDSGLVSLAASATLQRISSGYWRTVWQSTTPATAI